MTERTRKVERETRWVIQDGADFYIFRDAAMTSMQATWRAPIRVRDFDLPAAEKARELVTQQLKFSGYNIEWPNPFGESN